METIDAVVVGGGIAGLAAAYELRQRGIEVQLLETAARVGGVVVTERVDGWVIDGGPDALLVHKPGAIDLCRELGLGDRLISTLPPRTAYVLRNGCLCPLAEGSFLGFPVSLTALALSPLFSWRGKLRMACEIALPRGGGDDESIAAFVRRRFGEEAVEYLAEPLLAGIHAGDAERLSLAALFPQLRDAERRVGSVLRSLRALRVRPSPRGAFVSLRGGVGELVDVLAAAVGAAAIRLSTRVKAIHRRGVFIIDTESETLASRTLILGVPAWVTAAILGPVDRTLAQLCGAIAYASTATVALGYRRDQIDHPLAGSGPADGHSQLTRGRVLEHEAGRSAGHGPAQVAGAPEGGQHDDPAAGQRRMQRGGGLQAVPSGHLDVEQRHVRLELDDGDQRRVAVRGLADDRDVLGAGQ
jgi:oxygen-dependent protoporphyrinogen oxidase